MPVDTTFPGMTRTGTHAARPSPAVLGSGALYSCTDHNLIYQSDGSSWVNWATGGGGVGGASALDDLTDVDASAPVAGEVLTFDGAEWVPAAPEVPGGGAGFVGASVTLASGFNLPNATSSGADPVRIPMGLELYDTDGFFSPTTNIGRFTVPAGKAGKYFFTAAVTMINGTNTERWLAVVHTTKGTVGRHHIQHGAFDQPHVTGVVDMAEGDWLEVRITNLSTTLVQCVPSIGYTWFHLYQVTVGTGGGGASELDDLTDVNAPSPTNGQALVWDGSSSTWVPGSVASSGSGGGPVHGVRATAGSGEQNLANDVPEAVKLNGTETFDDGFHSGTNAQRITIPSGLAGMYLLHARVAFLGDPAGKRWSASARTAAPGSATSSSSMTSVGLPRARAC